MAVAKLAVFLLFTLLPAVALAQPSYPKPGFCRPDYTVTPCIVRPGACFSDDACTGSLKCCSYGCGRTCQNVTQVQCPAIDQSACPVSKCSSRGGYAEDADGCHVCACKEPDCPKNRPLRRCFRNPCAGRRCAAHPNAKCVPNYCGRCRAHFFVNGLKVNCRVTPTKRPTRPPTRPPVRSCGSNEVFRRCGTACERSCERPNPRVCTKQCIVNTCQCANRFYRRSSDRKCVRRAQCTQQQRRSCTLADGRVIPHGKGWKPDNCSSCTCSNGIPRCFQVLCVSVVNCPEGEVIVSPPGACCASCGEPPSPTETTPSAPTTPPPGSCVLGNGTVVPNGASFNNGPCFPCTCVDGMAKCAVIDCARPPCRNPITIPGRCCPVCPEIGIECQENETLSDCITPHSCEASCGNPRPGRCLIKQRCESGCKCKQGFIRDAAFGQCIRRCDCAGAECQSMECSTSNTEYLSPGPRRYSVCSFSFGNGRRNRFSPWAPHRHRQGCYCQSGFIELLRSDNSPVCFPEALCPSLFRATVYPTRNGY